MSTTGDSEFLTNPTQETVDVELAAHGLSIVEVQRNDAGSGSWSWTLTYNRRITATTPMQVTGPAAGIDLLQTSDDPTGTQVLGTLNNCAGGMTPWGTALTGEENFHQYFANLDCLAGRRSAPDRSTTATVLGEGASERQWEEFYAALRLWRRSRTSRSASAGSSKSIPTTRPRRRRSAPPSAASSTRAPRQRSSPGGQVVVYTGDDERFDYVYKFVTSRHVQPGRSRRQRRPARRGHALRRQVQRRRHGRVAAAGPWRGAARPRRTASPRRATS